MDACEPNRCNHIKAQVMLLYEVKAPTNIQEYIFYLVNEFYNENSWY